MFKKIVLLAAITILSGCVNNPHGVLVPTASSESWVVGWKSDAATKKPVTVCEATRLDSMTLTVEDDGTWTANLKVLNTDGSNYRDLWHNLVTVSFEIDGQKSVSLVVLDESMKWRTKETYRKEGTFSDIAKWYSKLDSAILHVQHECKGINVK